MNAAAQPPTARATERSGLRPFIIAAVVITVLFALPLWRVIQLGLHSGVLSYILLIPFISAYLIWKPRGAPSRPAAPDSTSSAIPRSAFRTPHSDSSSPLTPHPSLWLKGLWPLLALLGIAAFAAYLFAPSMGFSAPDSLTLSTAAYLLLLAAAAFKLIAPRYLRPHLFAIGFLVFFIPLPEAAIHGISVALQYVSADASEPFLNMTMPLIRDGLRFKLPGLTIFVAEECSGIRSTLVLFITSVLGGYIFLKNPWHRAIIAAAVFPLGVLRNAFRITSISWLTVNVDPGIIDSPLHHRGGPIFFVISLIPLFLLLWYLRRRELKGKGASPAPSTLTGTSATPRESGQG